MYWLYQDQDQWCVCEAGKLETSRPTGFPAAMAAATVLDHLRSASPGVAFVLFQDE